MNETGLGILGTILAIILLGGLAYIGENVSCSSKARGMGLQSDWGPWQGCLVKTKSGWIDIGQVKYEP